MLKEDFNKNLIDNIIIPSKHHSIFEHLWFNFYIDGIPKIGAMVLNNEKQYVTSEKSARYTTMKEMDSFQEILYHKWSKILLPVIDSVYPKIKDEKFRRDKIEKLAKENARYMTSVFTPTKMLYTINLRQLNFLMDQFDKGRLGDLSSDLECKLIPIMKDFSNQLNNIVAITHYERSSSNELTYQFMIARHGIEDATELDYCYCKPYFYFEKFYISCSPEGALAYYDKYDIFRNIPNKEAASNYLPYDIRNKLFIDHERILPDFLKKLKVENKISRFKSCF